MPDKPILPASLPKRIDIGKNKLRLVLLRVQDYDSKGLPLTVNLISDMNVKIAMSDDPSKNHFLTAYIQDPIPTKSAVKA